MCAGLRGDTLPPTHVPGNGSPAAAGATTTTGSVCRTGTPARSATRPARDAPSRGHNRQTDRKQADASRHSRSSAGDPEWPNTQSRHEKRGRGPWSGPGAARAVRPRCPLWTSRASARLPSAARPAPRRGQPDCNGDQIPRECGHDGSGTAFVFHLIVPDRNSPPLVTDRTCRPSTGTP